ncbi:hypothetical protein GE061_019515 [Apolygus lucorum]|uniref:Uncharacterized protein n=1 Tax=Apolygus lucorum TaxID=248454 RepID=A0A6A4JZK7_APOLU|nr:hypothetical protein GE061_019515 [Apolygus lucorum]
MLDRPFVFKLNDNGAGPNLLFQVFLERGWKEFSEDTDTKDQWNIWWRTAGFPTSHYKALKTWQFTNHVPKASAICRKDWLSRHLKCMRNNYGNIFDFSPEAYILPLDYTKLVETCSRLAMNNDKDDVWICKPVGLSQGKGISLFRKVSELTYDTNTVVQRYVRNPLLIGGYKFDLRLYVCVPCFYPLTIYMYREGLARFSTDKFSLSDLKNKYAHLTNCSLNKQGPGYSEMKDKVGAGCKWSLKQLRYYLNQNGFDDWLLWQRIANLIILTIGSQSSGIPATSNCFEFYGFDVLIDDTLKPWLLEVNISPALGTDCDVDPAVKKPMLHDMFDLLQLPVCNTGLSLFTEIPHFVQCNSSDEEMSIYNTVKKAASVVAIAQKWKKQIAPTSCSKLRDRKSKRASALGRKSPGPGKCPPRKQTSALSTCIVGQYTGRDSRFGTSDFLFPEHPKAERPKSMWDNGVDWNDAPNEEGDWVRVYPFVRSPRGRTYWNKQNTRADKCETDVRAIVSDNVKFYKAVRDCQIKHRDVADDVRDQFLINNDICEAVWHPYIS